MLYIENMIKHEIHHTNIKYDLSVRIYDIMMTRKSSVDHINNIDNAENMCIYIYICISYGFLVDHVLRILVMICSIP